jgi:hypothetical protein
MALGFGHEMKVANSSTGTIGYYTIHKMYRSLVALSAFLSDQVLDPVPIFSRWTVAELGAADTSHMMVFYIYGISLFVP